MMGWYQDGLGWGGWLVMVVSMIAFWALVVFAVVAVFRASREDGKPAATRPNPLDILDERFARGEIDESEYRARTDVLRGAVH